MKATKFLLIVAFFAFATMSYSTNQPTPQKSYKISLEEAITDVGLAKAIKKQVDLLWMMQIIPDGPHYEHIYYQHTHFVVYGKYEQWIDFLLGLPGTGHLDLK